MSNDREILLAQANARIEWLEWRLRETDGAAVAAYIRIEALETALWKIIEEGGFRDSAASKIARAALALEQDK